MITRKLGMISTINDDGSVAAITILSAPKNAVTQVKDVERDGYLAVQIGCEEETKGLNKALKGHLKPAKMNAKIIREIRVNELPELKIGDLLEADLFNTGDKVHATGTSKGKGFAGTIKRHNFSLGRKTHGGRNYRKPGSIGSMYPQKIFKGKKMAGQMGGGQVTTRNLSIALVDKERSVIGVYGAIPGPKKSVVVLRGKD